MTLRKSLLLMAYAALMAAAPVSAQDVQRWGVLDELAGRIWTTTSEGQARVSIYSWEVPGDVMMARHGTKARFDSHGEATFADTIQRLVLNRATGEIDVTYTYTDGRPELTTRMIIAPDGKVTEQFRDAAGTERLNVYLISDEGESLIDRQERRAKSWAALPTTRRRGQSSDQIYAERAALARQQNEFNTAQNEARAERARLAENSRIWSEQENALVDQILSDGMNRAAVIATAPVGMSYEDVMFEREIERRTFAAMNDPNNPLTQQQRHEGEEREASYSAERAELDRQNRQAEAREDDDREALAGANTYANVSAPSARNEVDRGAEDSLASERRAAQQLARNEELRRRQEADQQNRERQRREQADRQAESERQEQQRQRDLALAERTRIIEFKEAVVLCELNGPQAKFGNWRCEGPLQMTYVNFDTANYASAFAQMDCSSFRELPRSGPYRAFGCGYGLHPTNPGAGRNVPEMLRVYVDGRIIFRCPRNITGVCRSQ